MCRPGCVADGRVSAPVAKRTGSLLMLDGSCTIRRSAPRRPCHSSPARFRPAAPLSGPWNVADVIRPDVPAMRGRGPVTRRSSAPRWWAGHRDHPDTITTIIDAFTTEVHAFAAIRDGVTTITDAFTTDVHPFAAIRAESPRSPTRSRQRFTRSPRSARSHHDHRRVHDRRSRVRRDPRGVTTMCGRVYRDPRRSHHEVRTRSPRSATESPRCADAFTAIADGGTTLRVSRDPRRSHDELRRVHRGLFILDTAQKRDEAHVGCARRRRYSSAGQIWA